MGIGHETRGESHENGFLGRGVSPRALFEDDAGERRNVLSFWFGLLFSNDVEYDPDGLVDHVLGFGRLGLFLRRGHRAVGVQMIGASTFEAFSFCGRGSPMRDRARARGLR